MSADRSTLYSPSANRREGETIQKPLDSKTVPAASSTSSIRFDNGCIGAPWQPIQVECLPPGGSHERKAASIEENNQPDLKSLVNKMFQVSQMNRLGVGISAG